MPIAVSTNPPDGVDGRVELTDGSRVVRENVLADPVDVGVLRCPDGDGRPNDAEERPDRCQHHMRSFAKTTYRSLALSEGCRRFGEAIPPPLQYRTKNLVAAHEHRVVLLQHPGDPLRPRLICLRIGHEEIPRRLIADAAGHPARFPYG